MDENKVGVCLSCAGVLCVTSGAILKTPKDVFRDLSKERVFIKRGYRHGTVSG